MLLDKIKMLLDINIQHGFDALRYTFNFFVKNFYFKEQEKPLILIMTIRARRVYS